MIVEYNDIEFIKLNRKIKSWEWYTDVNTSHFFIYCLLKANWKDGRFQGKEVKRGSFVSSLEKMKTECGLSVQQIRTAINKLQSTGEITNKSYTKYRVITVNNYDQYQNNNKQDNKEDNKQVTNNQQTNNKQITTIEEDKNIRSKEDIKEKDIFSSNEENNIPKERRHDDLINLWNSLEDYGVAKIRSISGKRLISFRARLKEHGKDSFAECVEQIKQSRFLQTSNFFSFDWLVCETNYPKVLEGKYNDNTKRNIQQTFNADDFMKRFSDGN